MDEPSFANCSVREICSALGRLGGFQCVSGAKHTIKVKHPSLERPFPLPDHGTVNKNIVKNLVNNILIRQLGIPAETVYKELWC